MYKVMITCRTGTYRQTSTGWENEYHTITWAIYDILDEAMTVVHEIAKNNREVLRVWVEEK